MENWEETLREELLKDVPKKDRDKIEEKIRERLQEKVTPTPSIYFNLKCPSCSHDLRVRAKYEGKQVRCHHCDAHFIASPLEIPEKPKDNLFFIKIFILLCAVVCLAVTIFFVIQTKRENFERFIEGIKPDVAEVPDVVEVPEVPEVLRHPVKESLLVSEIEKLRKQNAQMKTALNEVMATAKEANVRSIKNNAKIQVAGVVINENAAILREGFDPKDAMLIGRRWHLERLPKHLILSEEDKKFLENLRGFTDDEFMSSEVREMDKGEDVFGQKKTTINARKILMLSIALNENSIIQRWRLSPQEVMLITEDWQFDKFPKFSTLKEDDKEFISTRIKPSSSSILPAVSKKSE